MGFFKNFIRNFLVKKYGIVTGSDFGSGYVVAAHKDGKVALGFIVRGKEDFIFVKSDISSVSLIGSNVKFNVDGNIKIGNKYQVQFSNGKSALVCIVLGNCNTFESIIY